MRISTILVAAAMLSACSQTETSAEACSRSAAHEVNWSNAEAPDVVTARSEGPSCLQATVTLAARNAAGDPLWVYASTYYELAVGGAAPESALPVTADEMDRFLERWANVTELSSNALPEWSEGAATLTESASRFTYETPLDRTTYEGLRARSLPMLCYAAAAETTRCLIVDPASHAPILMVAYGP